MSNETEKEASGKSTHAKPAAAKPGPGKSVSDKKSTATKKTMPGSNTKKSFILPVFFVLIFAASFIYIDKQLKQLEQNVDQTTIGNEDIIKDLVHRISDTNSQLTNIQKKIETLESKQDVLSHSLSQPVEQQIHINKDYALAEIQHLLVIASYNLELDNNVVTALSAMEAADARLTGLNDPRVIEVREQLIADMNELRSLNQADLGGLGLFLSDLVHRVDTLPLKEGVVIETIENKIASPEKQANGVKQFFILIWQELKSLVVITRDENISKARLLPDEIYFLRANIKLELANARFAVFNRDTDNLGASIEHIQTWLNDYFDLSDAAVRNIYDALTKMDKLELVFPKLDISSSLESVRALMRYQDTPNDDDEVEPLQ